MSAVRLTVVAPLRYRAVEREVDLSELEPFLRDATERLGPGDGRPPFAVFHGHVDEKTRSRVEVGVPSVDGDRELPGGRVAVGVAGEGETDYDGIHEIYGAVCAFIEANGLRQNGPTREVYLRGFDEIEVVWPVE